MLINPPEADEYYHTNMPEDDKLIYKDLSFNINGILFKVHNDLGRFRNEKEYGDRIEFYFKQDKIKYEREKVIPVSFEGERGGRNKVDFEVEGRIFLEIKTIRVLDRECYYQLKRYLVSDNKKLGILVNFRETFLKPRRVLNPTGIEEK
jgi:GxxExxY protein